MRIKEHVRKDFLICHDEKSGDQWYYYRVRLIRPDPLSGAIIPMKGVIMPRVVVKENEDLDSALRRFKRQVNNSGVLAKVRAKEFYVKPGVARRLKSEAARKKRRK